MALVFTGCGIKASPRPPELPVAAPAETAAPVDAEPALDPSLEDEVDPFEEETIF